MFIHCLRHKYINFKLKFILNPDIFNKTDEFLPFIVLYL